jgi:predicted O-linked N-acetylglucosamine transferase (SPINDLY family)
LAALHAEWDRRHAAALRGAWRPHAVARDPQRSLRLGFVSGDFGRHPVGRFSIRILEALRGQACQVLCYANSVPADEITARFAALSTWREVAALGDDALAEQIRADRIDVLFDLAGHSAFNRLPVFARKPAPLQITWIGYEGTTGLRAMDYLLADACQIRPEEEPCYVEKVLRLPTRYVCYDPPSDAPPVRKKGISPICRNGPEGAAHKLDLSPFTLLASIDSTAASTRSGDSRLMHGCPSKRQHWRWHGWHATSWRITHTRSPTGCH